MSALHSAQHEAVKTVDARHGCLAPTGRASEVTRADATQKGAKSHHG